MANIPITIDGVLYPSQEWYDQNIAPQEDTTILPRDISGGSSQNIVGSDIGDSNIITSDNSETRDQLTFQTPENVPVFDITKLDFGLTPQETKAQVVTEDIQKLNLGLEGESAFRTGEEERRGIEGLTQNQQDLANQLKILQNEALGIPLQAQQEAEGRGITVGGLRPKTTGRLRENAIKALTVSALSQAARGNLATAMNLVDRAVDQQFDPIREQIATATKNLNLILNSPEATQAEKKRAAEQLLVQKNQELLIDAAQAEQKAIWDLSLTAVKNGADAVTLQKMRDAATKEEASKIMVEAGFGKPEEKIQTTITEINGVKTLINSQTGETIKVLGEAEANDYVWLDELITLNPNATYEQLFNELRTQKGDRLSDSEVRNYLATKGFKPSTDTTSTTEDEEDFLNEDYFRGLFTDDELKKAAKKAGFSAGGGIFGSGAGEEGVKQYLQDLMRIIGQYRTAGFTDKEILKLMQE